jgi:predicted ATP-binding protein involved in virulence
MTNDLTYFSSDELAYSISLERLNLKSFRCFGDLEINFDSRLTVFIAENGGGKTTVLDAIAECLKAYLAALKVNGYKTNLIPNKDVKIGETYANCSLLVDIDYVSEIIEIVEQQQNAKEDNEQQQNSENEVKKEKVKKETRVREITNNVVTTIAVTTAKNEQVDEATAHFYQQAQPYKNYTKIDFPVLVYYGGNSVPVDYNDKEKTNLDKVSMVYKDALSSSRFHFTTFLNWWKEKEYDMLRLRDITSPEFITLNDQFTKLKRAIEFILNDNPTDPTYTDLCINEELKMGMDKKTHDGGTQFVEINQFSSGEKALFAFVADLGLRLLYATPLATNIDADNAYRILGKGIVLIDEVDLHLHPKWQQKIIGKLMTIFPEVQFVVTTHSPFVVSSFVENNPTCLTYRLTDFVPKVERFGKGQSADYVLSELMDVDTTSPIVEKYVKLLRENQHETPEGLQLKEWIDTNIDTISGDAMRLNFALKRLKSIGK